MSTLQTVPFSLFSITAMHPEWAISAAKSTTNARKGEKVLCFQLNENHIISLIKTQFIFSPTLDDDNGREAACRKKANAVVRKLDISRGCQKPLRSRVLQSSPTPTVIVWPALKHNEAVSRSLFVRCLDRLSSARVVQLLKYRTNDRGWDI